MYVDDIKLAWKKQNIDPMWKQLMKDVDLGEPTSFLDHVYFGCTQRACQTSKDIVDNYRSMFESRISAGATEKLPCSGVPRGSSETVQAWVQHGQDGGRQQGPDSEIQVVRNSISFSRVSVQCQLRWESLWVSRRLSGQGDTDGRSFE